MKPLHLAQVQLDKCLSHEHTGKYINWSIKRNLPSTALGVEDVVEKELAFCSHGAYMYVTGRSGDRKGTGSTQVNQQVDACIVMVGSDMKERGRW